MMTNDTTPGGGATEPNGQASGAEAAPEQALQTPDRIAELEAEKTDLKERLLRTLAEMENLRRRTEREIQDARTYGVTNFARDMLTVADNIRRALDNVPAGAADGATKALVEGIELTERDLLKTLERHGVKKVEPQGQKFDPNMHQAMFEVPNEELPAGTVTQVIQTGYAIGDRVLRPALVGVSKGGPKASAQPVPAEGTEGPASNGA
ncbi:nucleotide exchange factor GrpE [Enterovirga sp. CN4-39]|uniref:nucleotide exchange factor GrpE n=1 Tax=Enterovirga sp. CN4-39 TaxID=3400910 RepID=UPI003C03D194